MATACFWLVTLRPLRPERNFPSPYSCITLLILRFAFGPYLRLDDFLLDERFLVAMLSSPIFSLEPSRPFSVPSTDRWRSLACGSSPCACPNACGASRCALRNSLSCCTCDRWTSSSLALDPPFSETLALRMWVALQCAPE